MILYVGYILTDYANAIFASTNKSKVEQALKAIPNQTSPQWVDEYDLDNDNLIEFECD